MSFSALAICLDDNNTKKQPLIGLATLMSLLFAGNDLSAIGAQLLEKSSGDDAEALLDLSILIQLKGDHDTGVALQQQALMLKQHYTLIPENLKNPIKLLAIMAPGDLMTNTPLEFITEALGIKLEILYVSKTYPLPECLPKHDIAMVAVSELDRNYQTLKYLESNMKNWPKPIINKPHNIVEMARDRTSLMLQNLTGINMPITLRINRGQLEGIGKKTHDLIDYLDGNTFPFIIRPIDSHAGSGLTKIMSLNEINDYLLLQIENDFFISPFIDYCSTDKQYRKYRIALIKGKPYIVHMAISDHWMVHYANAGMIEDQEKRNEEQKVMDAFDDAFALRHKAAFRKIYQHIGLEYIGVDCGETLSGELLIFEAGNSLAVHSLDSADVFPYKKAQINKIFKDFEVLLKQTQNTHAKNKSFELIKN